MTILDAIVVAQARAAELDALVIELQAKEVAAVSAAKRRDPSANAYNVGTEAEKCRRSWKKAQEDRERLNVELDALAVQRAQEIVNEANERFEAAVKEVRKHRPTLEKIYAEAGPHIAALAELWLRAKDEYETFSSKVVAGRGLAEAAVTNLDARGQWNEATGSLSDLGPAPRNVAYFIEQVLAAGLDPQHEDEYRINAMRRNVGIPDMRACNVPANFHADLGSRGGSSFADSVQIVAVRNEPKPEPNPPTDEQIALEAVRAADEERRFRVRQAHLAGRRGYVDTQPTWSAADPTGLSEKQPLDLGELQTH